MGRQETVISVSEFIEDIHCIDSKHGEDIARMILNLWQQGQTVVLDFEGTELVLASFINSMYALLSQQYTLDKIRSQLRYLHLNNIELYEIRRSEQILAIHNEINEELRHTIAQLTDGK